MLYRLVRPFATIALKTNFRKIYFSNAQAIPKNKPVILAVNHPTAFIEPCILACLLQQPLHFMVRGDMFKNNLVQKIFDLLHLIPIYRLSDAGYSGLKNNYKSFDKCYETLKDNKTILILAEGNTIQEKRLRPIQKGTARMALGALEKYPEMDLQIVPVGVNYTYADRFRSQVMFQFGQALPAKKYFDLYLKAPNKAIGQLTSSLKIELEKLVTIIEKKEDEELVEKLFIINRNNFPAFALPVVSLNNHLLESEKGIAASINGMAKEGKKELNQKVDKYFKKLKELKIQDWAVAQENAKLNLNWLPILFGSVPFVIGYSGNYLPALFANYIATTKVKYLEFIASVRITVAVGAFLLYYFLLLILSLALKNIFLVGFVLLLPFFGYYAILYKEYFQKWSWLRGLRKIDITKKVMLKKERKSLLNQL